MNNIIPCLGFKDNSLRDRVRFVLVRTTHPGNIGAAARAMKNMGLKRLYLVRPEHFPDAEVTARAAGANDLLANAVVVETLEQALVNCRLVIGTSARSRTLPWPMLSPRQCAEKIALETGEDEVAIVFGQERSGLSNEELADCHYHVQIPTDPNYSSLNLAQAVQVLAYELRTIVIGEYNEPARTEKRATADAMHAFYKHLEKVLIELKFLDPDCPKQLMHRMKRLFNRAQVEELEMNILRGILSAIEKKSNQEV